MKSIALQTQECAKPLNDLARLGMITKLEQDILIDMMVCEIEGWDRMEYIRMIYTILERFINREEHGHDESDSKRTGREPEEGNNRRIT